MSQTDAPQTSATQPVEPKKASPIRLIVLLAILAIVLTGFLVDMFWMFDSVKAASNRLQAAADEMALRPHEKGRPQFLNREGVVQAIGFPPTNSKVDESGQLIEQYRWWGSLPLQRRFIEVTYSDRDGNIYDKYEISNRDIFGNDVDPDEVNNDQQPAAPVDASGTATDPAQLSSPPMPMGITGPPTTSGNEPADDEPKDSEEPKTPDTKEPSSSPEGATDPAEKKDDSPE